MKNKILFSIMLGLAFVMAIHLSAFAVIWTATTESGKYEGQIVINEGESHIEHGTWWADEVVINGTLYVRAWSTSNKDRGQITINANTITIGPNGRIYARGIGFTGGSGGSGGTEGSGGSRGTSSNAPGNGATGSPGEMGSRGEGYSFSSRGNPSGEAGEGGSGGEKGAGHMTLSPKGGKRGFGGASAAAGDVSVKNGYNNSPLNTSTTLYMGSGGAGGNGGGLRESSFFCFLGILETLAF